MLYQGISRVFCLGISAIFYLARELRRAVVRVRGGSVAGEGVVLCYHAISARHAIQFAWQMKTVLTHSTPVRPDFIGVVPPDQRYTAITFDDGHRSVAENALPLMRERGIPCAIFFITELLGKPAPWAGLEGYEIHDTYLTEDELKRLDESMVIVGSHTTSHERLPCLSKSERLKQFLDSRACLESLTGRPVRLFAFPFGAQSQDCITESAESGYERVFTVEPTVGFIRPNEFVCGRVVVDPDDWRVEFFLKLTGAYNWRSPVFALRDKVRLAFGRNDRITVGKAESICIESSMLELTEKDSILVPN